MAVFISYRREDSEGDARAIYNRLAEETDAANLFLDFEAIGGGDDWKSRIDENLGKVGAVLVVIGPRWLELLKIRATAAAPDEVRREIAAALLKPGLRVLPVLVKGAKMPAAAEMPEDVQALATRNAIEVRGTSWTYDIDRVVKALRKAGALPTSRRTWLWRGGAVAAVLAVAGAAYAARVEVPVVPKNMSHKYAKRLVESHGLKFQPRVLPYTTDGRGTDAVTASAQALRPPAGTRLFRWQSVEVELITLSTYYLICRGGGVLGKIATGEVIPFERHKGLPSPDMKPGSCAFVGGEIHSNQDEFLRPLGFKDELLRAFERAPGNILALCVFSEYDLLEKLKEKVVKSERYATLDYHEYMIRDDNGKLLPKLNGHICVDRL